jgi:hypothetical protein
MPGHAEGESGYRISSPNSEHLYQCNDGNLISVRYISKIPEKWFPSCITFLIFIKLMFCKIQFFHEI